MAERPRSDALAALTASADRRTRWGGGARGVVHNRPDDRWPQLARHVVAHAGQDQQLGTGDRLGGGAVPGDVDQRIGIAVDARGGIRSCLSSGVRSAAVTTAAICRTLAAGWIPQSNRRPPGALALVLESKPLEPMMR
jgi:hypothetical protein